MSKGFFVTGTDTGVGKTVICLGMIAALQAQNYNVCGFKPVAAGGTLQKGEWLNEDVQALQSQSSVKLTNREINPFFYVRPTVPLIAAQYEGMPVSLDRVTSAYRRIKQVSDYVIVEGVGGWLVPLAEKMSVADLAREFKLPVILTVAVKLGSFNHALLSAERIVTDGCELAGWVANHVEPGFVEAGSYIVHLKKELPVPLVAEVPYLNITVATELADYFEPWIGGS